MSQKANDLKLYLEALRIIGTVKINCNQPCNPSGIPNPKETYYSFVWRLCNGGIFVVHFYPATDTYQIFYQSNDRKGERYFEGISLSEFQDEFQSFLKQYYLNLNYFRFDMSTLAEIAEQNGARPPTIVKESGFVPKDEPSQYAIWVCHNEDAYFSFKIQWSNGEFRFFFNDNFREIEYIQPYSEKEFLSKPKDIVLDIFTKLGYSASSVFL